MQSVDIFGNILLPSTIWHMTKEDECEGYKRLGHEHTMKMTWFCHTPVIGLPCGHCNPCKDARNEGMAWRLSFIGSLLHYPRQIITMPRLAMYRLCQIVKKLIGL